MRRALISDIHGNLEALEVVLSDIQEMRYAEIAQILAIPEGTVKSRLFRGRRLLQRTLRGYAEDMGYIKPVTLAVA